jgi:tRNA-specific 2-thiouridylase
MKVAIAMSGGVDSSVAAALLVKQGHEVAGITMRIYSGGILHSDAARHACYGPDEDVEVDEAREVCRALNIEHHVFDLKKEYKETVLDYFCHEYTQGKTPNPCIVCNSQIKFGALFDRALEAGIADHLATGHYARCGYDSAARRYLLMQAKDRHKDQSYFLAFLSQKQLSRALFPLADCSKEEVRKIAEELGLCIKDKPESQDFMSADFHSILEPMQSGAIINSQKEVIGVHHGISNYTIGQRKHLGISSGKPLYVTDIDPEKNTVTVGAKNELLITSLRATRLNWVAIEALDKPVRIKARIRSTHGGADAEVIPLNQEMVEVKFLTPQIATAPGQAIVFYDGTSVVGAGIITKNVN